MKSNTYTVYVHLNQANGEVVYSNFTCAAGKGGRCKHIVALLFQIIEYKQLDMTEIPDQLTCTQLLQQWHVPIIAMCQLHMCNCCTQSPHLLDLNEHIRCMCYFSWQHLYIL